MDYTLGCDERGRFYAEFSMGHEALGRWLCEELGPDPARTGQLLERVDDLQQRRIREFELRGAEFDLFLDREEVRVRSHLLDGADELPESEGLDFYDDELESGCGLEDFRAVLEAWRDLIEG